MNEMNRQSSDGAPTPSVYVSGARDGLPLGIYMLAVFLTAAYSIYQPVLSLVFMVLFVGLPVVLYLMLKRDFMRYPQLRFFSAVTMHGIATFFFGALIFSAGVFVFLKWIEPYYFAEMFTRAIDAYSAFKTPEAAQMADTLRQMLDRGLIPTAGQFAFDIIWSVMFSGCLLSMVLAWILRLRHRSMLKQ